MCGGKARGGENYPAGTSDRRLCISGSPGRQRSYGGRISENRIKFEKLEIIFVRFQQFFSRVTRESLVDMNEKKKIIRFAQKVVNFFGYLCYGQAGRFRVLYCIEKS